MKRYKKKYQIFGCIFLLLLIFSVVTVIFKGLIGLFPVILCAMVLGGIINRLQLNDLIEFGKKYLETTDLQKEKV